MVNEGGAAHAATIVARGHHHGGVSPSLGHAHGHLHRGLVTGGRKKSSLQAMVGETKGEDQTRTEQADAEETEQDLD